MAPLHGFTFETVDGGGPDEVYVGVDQAWSQGYLPNEGRGGLGSVFAATSFDCWYDRNKQPVKPGPTPGYTPLRLQVGKLTAIRATSFKRSFPPYRRPRGLHREAKPDWLESTEVSMSPFRSRHPKSALFLLADGSVISITPSVDLSVYLGYGSISGGEVFATVKEGR